MANLRDIRNRISSIQNTQQITKAMQMVAAAKLRKAQNRIEETKPYAQKMKNVVGRLAKNTKVENPLLRNEEQKDRYLFIVVGSDRGLCGGFNNNLFKEVTSYISEHLSDAQEEDRLDMICIGRKAVGFFPKRGYNVIEKHAGFFDDLNYDATADIMESVRQQFVDETYDEVFVCYNEFKTVISQNRMIDSVLPIQPESLIDEEEQDDQEMDYIFEPDPQQILDHLLPLHLNIQLWKAVLDSNAAEQGARMTAMDSATENAKELEQDLKLEYNQARQSAITTEISEIVSGAQALEES